MPAGRAFFIENMAIKVRVTPYVVEKCLVNHYHNVGAMHLLCAEIISFYQTVGAMLLKSRASGEIMVATTKNKACTKVRSTDSMVEIWMD